MHYFEEVENEKSNGKREKFQGKNRHLGTFVFYNIWFHLHCPVYDCGFGILFRGDGFGSQRILGAPQKVGFYGICVFV